MKLLTKKNFMKTYIWTLPTRIFHWLLAIGFIVAFILGDFDNLKNLHFAFGAFVGALVFFRLLFGIFGPKYSNFKDFPLGISHLKEFVVMFFKNPKVYAGHNPLASVIMLLILIVGLLCSISGYLTYSAENNLFTGLNEDFIEEAHEVLANLFLILVVIHLIGVLFDSLCHYYVRTAKSMLTGYKNIDAKDAKLNIFHKAFIILWLTVPFYLFYAAYGLQTESKDIHKKSKKHEYYEDYKYEDHDD